MKAKSRPGALFSLLLAAALLLASCTPGKTPTPAPVQTEAGPTSPPIVVTVTPLPPGGATTPQANPISPVGGSGKTATIVFLQDFDTLNPLYSQNLSAVYTQPVYSCPAWAFDNQNNAVPRLVAEMPSLQNGGISQDGRVITMKLREDTVWSDGQPLTAQDFVFTYQMITNANNAISPVAPYDQLTVTAPDDRTVVVTFNQPYAPWQTALWKALLPKHVLEPVFQAQGSLQGAEWNMAPTVGCGPFVFQSWERGQSATFVANERYWLGRPKLDAVQVRFVADDNAKVEALKSGQADLTVFVTNSALYIPALQNAGLQVLPVNSGYVEGWFFYLDPTNSHPGLRDVRVRQALALGLDRSRMMETLVGTDRQLAASYWDNTPYVDPSVKPWPYDPERARALLEEAGWVDSNGNGTRDKAGHELVFTYGTIASDVRTAVQNEAKRQLAEIGVTLDISSYDAGTFLMGYYEGGPAARGTLDIFEYAARTKNYPDPGTNDFLCAHIPTNFPEGDDTGENWSWLCDETLDPLLQAQSTQIDFQQRQATFHQISKMIYENVYFLGLWTDPDIWASSQRLQNVQLSGISPLANIAEWDVAQ